jgi:hypothetical protein
MKIRFAILVLLCLLVMPALAQRIDYANGEKKFKRVYSKIIGQDDKGTYIVRSQSPFNGKTEQLRFRDNRIEICFMENNLNIKWAYTVILPNADGEIQDVLFMGDSLYIFYAAVNKDAGTNELFAVQVNTLKGGIEKSPLKVDEIQFDKKRNKGVFYIGKSKDQSKFFSMYKQTIAESDKVAINMKVYSDTFARLWERRYATDFTDGILLLNDYQLDNDGNVLLLTSIDSDKKVNRDKRYSLVEAAAAKESLTYHPLRLENYYITDLKLAIDYLNNKMVLAGFFSELNSFSSAGIFYTTIDRATGETKRFSESFKAKFLNEFTGERTINRGTELINYYIDRIVLRSDGGVILVAESYYVTESTNYNSYYQLYTTSYTYHYDNVLIFSVNREGKLDWENIIRKNQVSEDDGAFYSSYIMAVDADKIHFVYNKYVQRGTDVLRFTVNNKGQSIEKVLVKSGSDILLMPGGGRQITADQVLIPCLQKNKTNFIRITF